MYKLSFFVPPEFAEQVKQAVFKAGAGHQGEYAQCCWQTMGTGQFMPLSKSKPFIGQHGTLEKIEELKVEMICSDSHIREVVKQLKLAHPFEEPAYDVIKLESF